MLAVANAVPFLQTDPVPGGSANAYDYCSQDPINCYDLQGTFSIRHLIKKATHVVAKHWRGIAQAAIIAAAVVGSAACVLATAGICGVAIGQLAVTAALGAAEMEGRYAVSSGKHTAAGYAVSGVVGLTVGGSYGYLAGSSVFAAPEGEHAAATSMSRWLGHWFG